MRQAGASPAQWDVWGASLKEGMYFPLRNAAAGRKKKNVITYENAFLLLWYLHKPHLRNSVTLHSNILKKQPEHTKHLKSKGWEKAVSERRTAHEVRPWIQNQ